MPYHQFTLSTPTVRLAPQKPPCPKAVPLTRAQLREIIMEVLG
jgi:hypothetical protein